MLKIGDKTFLNLQEAVAWLMENNCIPFQCTAPYAANTEIGMGTLVNPSPAKVRIGSIIFFSDSKVSTVTGITQNSFIVSDEYNDLVDDVVYVSNVALNASGHLIVTLSNDEQIDAGLIKQILSFSIDASQHLIASFNDGTTQDLGAIFNGNITIAGDLTVGGAAYLDEINSGSSQITAKKPIVEAMTGYSMTSGTLVNLTKTDVYGGIVKNGDKLTIAYACKLNKDNVTLPSGSQTFLTINIPSAVGAKLYVAFGSLTLARAPILASNLVNAARDVTVNGSCYKQSNTQLTLTIPNADLDSLTALEDYYIRFEFTFLLSNSLI